MKKGKIYQSLSGFYDVLCDDKIYRTRARGNFRKKKITPIVGDDVEFQMTNENEGYLLKILPRRNSLVRPPIANIDQALLVTSAVEPDFSYNLLDRQLVSLEINNIKPIIYFTKLDLLSDDKIAYFEKIQQDYEQIGYQTILPGNLSHDDLNHLLVNLLKDKETVFMGQTGAGKSTLLNTISPGLKLQTGEISKVLNRGKHTTRKVSLMEVNGGLVADTPGFSSYDVLNIDAQDLRNYFPEFKRNANECKFRGCVHINEPSCKIKQLLSSGLIEQTRYDNYLSLYNIIKNRKPIYNKK
ncbi:ribosome small subunit-dependent GTPase A [Apilactobacillus sp. M161]|uniref:Small ribosomal subunit biogenesis GTPase RsgA n=1 Tax=Apilactobacillus xinyiensis TaxID=2841032 RepID=A0ABT0I038_9LACO|nr:ribosome small subunit-dependent GTPase A [Apilactobacillus xinyiensis]MCK8624163.1 ribosome small subunit-dependent GTPase A [Apilactobacillus xinyiensis]